MSKRFGTPKSTGEVDKLFFQIAKAQEEQRYRVERYNRRLEDMKKRTERIIRALDKKIKHKRTNIFLYYILNWKQLTENGRKKIITLLSGNKFGTYWVQSGVKILNSERAITTLEMYNLQRFVLKKINKRAILQEPKAVFGIKDILIGKRKMFKVVPKKTGIAVTLELRKLKKTVK